MAGEVQAAYMASLLAYSFHTSIQKGEKGCMGWLRLEQSSACQTYSSCPGTALQGQWGPFVSWSWAKESTGLTLGRIWCLVHIWTQGSLAK